MIFSSRDIKRFNKNSPPIKIESGYTHVHVIAVPKEGYSSVPGKKSNEDLCNRLFSAGGSIHDVRVRIADIMFMYDLPAGANHELSTECGRIARLCEETYSVASRLRERQ